MNATKTTYRTLDGRILAEMLPGQPLDHTAFAQALDSGGIEAQPAALRPQTPQMVPAEPDAAEMAVNFVGAVARWIAAGAPVVAEADYQARSAACEPCEYWDGHARFGLGKCKAPGCGCTSFKRWLSTERCKHPQGSRWPALPVLKPAVP